MSLKKILTASSNFEKFLKTAQEPASWTTPHFPHDIYDKVQYNVPDDLKPDLRPISKRVQSAIGANPDGVLGQETYNKLISWKSKHPEIKAQNAKDLIDQIDSWWTTRDSGPIYFMGDDAATDPYVSSEFLSKDQLALRQQKGLKGNRLLDFDQIQDSEIAKNMPGGSKSVVPPNFTNEKEKGSAKEELKNQYHVGPTRDRTIFDDKNNKGGSMSIKKLLKVAADYQGFLKYAQQYRDPGVDHRGYGSGTEAYDSHGNKMLLDPDIFTTDNHDPELSLKWPMSQSGGNDSPGQKGESGKGLDYLSQSNNTSSSSGSTSNLGSSSITRSRSSNQPNGGAGSASVATKVDNKVPEWVQQELMRGGYYDDSNSGGVSGGGWSRGVTKGVLDPATLKALDKYKKEQYIPLNTPLYKVYKIMAGRNNIAMPSTKK